MRIAVCFQRASAAAVGELAILHFQLQTSASQVLETELGHIL